MYLATEALYRYRKKVVMHFKMLHHFYNTFSPDEDPRLGRKVLEINLLLKVYQPIPAEYHEIDTATRKD